MIPEKICAYRMCLNGRINRCMKTRKDAKKGSCAVLKVKTKEGNDMLLKDRPLLLLKAL